MNSGQDVEVSPSAPEVQAHARWLVDQLIQTHRLEGGERFRLDLKASAKVEAVASMTASGPEISISTGLIEQLAVLTLNMAQVEREAQASLGGEQRNARSASFAGNAKLSGWLALHLLYLHELSHIRLGHLGFPLPDAPEAGQRLIDHPLARIAARAALEYEADMESVAILVNSLARLGSGSTRTVVSAVASAAVGCYVMTELFDRHVHGHDPAALVWSSMGRFTEGQIHPSLLTRRFLILTAAVAMFAEKEARDALEAAWNHGAAMAKIWMEAAYRLAASRSTMTAQSAPEKLLGMALVEMIKDAHDPYEYAIELQLRLKLLRKVGVLPSR
jgi:hypothetical protein